MTVVLCSFIEVNITEDRGIQKAAATPHRSTSRNLSREANSYTGINIHAAREHQDQNEAVCDHPACK